MADRRLVEHVAENGRNVGGGLDHRIPYRGILHGFEKRNCFIAGLHASAQRFGLLAADFRGRGRRAARHDQHDRPHLIFEAFGLRLILVVGIDLDRRGNVFLADLQALLEPASHQAAPHHLGLDAGLQRFRPDALALERLGELIRGDSHPRTHLCKCRIDIGRGGIDAELLGFLDLQLLVDQILDHLLPGGGLLRREGGELAALLDIVVGDRLAIDHHGDGLRMQLRSAGRQQEGHGSAHDHAKKE